jgi:hypothetical protein
MKKISIVICLFSILNVFSEVIPMKQKLIYSDDFKNGTSNWIAEFENTETSSMKIVDGKLDVSSSVGATVWFKSKLSGNLLITYDESIIDAGGPNDRVSDMNVFWMASDPLNQSGMIKRDGKFSSYDKLNLYYAGIGGHYNKYTRFRKYTCDGNKPVLQEYTDAAHLLVGNKKYSIKIIVKDSLIQYYLNDELFWELKDNTPYKEGYFGFRTTISHQQFENFRVYQLK